MFLEFRVRSFYWGKAKRGEKCIIPLQAVVGMKATAWMCERREVTLSEHDLLVGLQGHLSAAFHCGRAQLSRNPYGGEGGACSVNRPPLSPVWMWPPASGSLCCTATAWFLEWLLNLPTFRASCLWILNELELWARSQWRFWCYLHWVGLGHDDFFCFQDRDLPKSWLTNDLSAVSTVSIEFSLN